MFAPSPQSCFLRDHCRERGLRKIIKVADRVRIITSDFKLISCVAAPAAAVENVWSSTEIKYKADGELEI